MKELLQAIVMGNLKRVTHQKEKKFESKKLKILVQVNQVRRMLQQTLVPQNFQDHLKLVLIGKTKNLFSRKHSDFKLKRIYVLRFILILLKT